VTREITDIPTPSVLNVAREMKIGFTNWKSLLFLTLISRYVPYLNPTVHWRTRLGTTIVIPPGDRTWWSVMESFSFDCYRLRELTPTHSFSFLDIGANVGTFSLAVAQCFPGANGLAIEPVPNTFRYLRTNLAQNGLQYAVSPIWGAVTPNGREISIYCDPRDSSRATVMANEFDRTYYRVDVPGHRLRDLVRGYESGIDLVKIDIEGAEYELIEEVVQLINELRVSRLVIEYHNVDGHSHHDLISRLDKDPMTLVNHDRSSSPGVGLVFFDRMSQTQ
jgi:FkbM family methyltransferase